MQTISFISDFNLTVLTRLVSSTYSDRLKIIDNSMSSMEKLINNSSEIDQINGITFLWFSPENVSPSFNKAANNNEYNLDDIINEFDSFFKLVSNFRQTCSTLIIPTFHQISSQRNYGILDLRSNLGIKNLLQKVNSRMIESFELDEDIFVLDHTNWLSKSSFSPKMWFSAKVPYDNEVFKFAAEDLKTIIKARQGQTKKLAIIDLDNTLWGGVVGDDGWENLRLGGHDPIGESFVDFQKQILSLSKKGILLAICSKNTESVALEAIEKHPEMILRLDDFSSYRINWNDKAANIKSICEELNLGTQSTIFFDDNINERERVKAALPEVSVPDLPNDPRMYSSFFSSLTEFDSYSLTDEDRNRKELYKQRKAEKLSLADEPNIGSLDDWLLSLDIKLSVEGLNERNITRTVQLLNKTNQMNLSTRRMNKEELLEWVDDDSNFLWTFRVADKFGDSGLTGIASVTIKKENAILVDFILSCRVMGKQIENAMLSFITNFLTKKEVKEIEAKFIHTEKNKPCYDFLLSSQLKEKKEDFFIFALKDQFKKPEAVDIQFLDK